jgi:N-acetylglucosamine kinase-like BadF-type ATPase
MPPPSEDAAGTVAPARCVIGVDAGATKTVGLLADEAGRILAQARGSGANLHVQGEAQVEAVLQALFAELGGIGAVRAVCIGMAGVDRPHDEEVVRGLLARLGHRDRVRIAHDAWIALVAGSPAHIGIVVSSGTGSIAFGIDTGGRTARAGGFGSLLGDEGSGYWLGNHALRAVVRASDGRGPATRLTAMVFEALAIRSVDELVPLVYEHHLPRSAIAGLAGRVERARAQGDGVAADLLARAADELVAAAQAVSRKLRFDKPHPVVLAGGVFQACPSLARLVTDRLGLPLARPTVLEREPAHGAVSMALDLLV